MLCHLWQKQVQDASDWEDLLQFNRSMTWGILVFQPWFLPGNSFIVYLNLKDNKSNIEIKTDSYFVHDENSPSSFLTFWGIFFLLVLVSFCVVEASLPLPSCSTTSAGLFALLSVSWRLPGVCGTFESRLRSNFTSRDLGGLWGSRELLAVWPVFSSCLWAVLWGIFVPFWQVVLDFGLLQLVLTGAAGDSWSGWAGLWVGQEQGFGYCTPHDGQWPNGTSAASGSDPALCLSSDVCLDVRLLSFLVSLLSLLFLLCPVFVFTLGLSVTHGSLALVATTSSHFMPRAASVQPASDGFEEYVVHESFLLQLFKSAEGGVWLLCCLKPSRGLSLYFWGFPRLSVTSVCWEERWGSDSPLGSTTSKVDCLELWVGGGCLWAGLSETCAPLWPSAQEFCWLDLIQFPNCQSTWFTPGESGYKKTQI